MRIATLLMLQGASALKVTVCGGTGFVGSRVCKQLVDAGAEVTSVSKSGMVPAWASGEEWTSKVTWVKNDPLDGARENLEAAIGSPDAVVSCVGAVGFDKQNLIQNNGKVNQEIAVAAKKTGTVKEFVLVSVSKEVDESVGWLVGRSERIPAWGEGYFEGKARFLANLEPQNAQCPGRASLRLCSRSPVRPFSFAACCGGGIHRSCR